MTGDPASPKPPEVPSEKGGSKPPNDLRLRVISSMVIVPTVALAVFMGGILFHIAVLIVAVLMAIEWGTIIGRADRIGAARFLVLTAVVPSLAISFFVGPLEGIALAVCLGILVGVVAWRAQVTEPFWCLVASLCTTIPAIAVVWLRDYPEGGLAMVLWCVVTVSITDISAYVTGRAIGGPKLWPAVSPGKTWSGALGGAASSVVVALVTVQLVEGARLEVLIPAGIGISVVGQLGDLAESAFKRHFKIKDSGHLIPGHGGILDRVDAQIVAIPILALAVAISGASIVGW
jgi:phosphatidate cytidylyltransferase